MSEKLKFKHLRKSINYMYYVYIDIIHYKDMVQRQTHKPFDTYEDALKYIKEQKKIYNKKKEKFIIYLVRKTIIDNLFIVNDEVIQRD